MGTLQSIVTPLHQATKRDCLARMNDDKAACMAVAKEYGKEYWDGDRRFGYGGYKFIPGRWAPVAEALILEYALTNSSKILDVGCGKGFLLYELKKLLPGLEVHGFDISRYALECLPSEISGRFFQHDASSPFEYEDKEFDLVISLGCLHNLSLPDLQNALAEIERVGRRAFIMVESYRNDRELFNLQCWALTAKTFLETTEWEWLLGYFGYFGDYEFIFFEE
jgi:SAM-dependent methyltransferase